MTTPFLVRQPLHSKRGTFFDTSYPGDTPPDLIADIDTARPPDNPAAISIFNKHVHAMDESYHSSGTSILGYLRAMSTDDRYLMEQLHAQVQDLEHMLAMSEEGCVKLGKQLKVGR